MRFRKNSALIFVGSLCSQWLFVFSCSISACQQQPRSAAEPAAIATRAAESTEAAGPAKPAAPPLHESEVFTFDPSDSKSFSPQERRQLLADWGPCSESLYGELLAVRQAEQSSSAFNVTNCAFDESIAQAKVELKLLQFEHDAGKLANARSHFARVLYMVQSFYANSNYVELTNTEYAEPAKVPLFRVWSPEAAATQLEQRDSLVSGTDLTAQPKKCPKGVYPRRQVSKALGGEAAKIPAASWKGWTQHDVAIYLASSDGFAFARWANKKFPRLFESCNGIVIPALLEDPNP
jgi:hypothetical protein